MAPPEVRSIVTSSVTARVSASRGCSGKRLRWRQHFSRSTASVPGDRVAICAANCAEWIQLFWATASLNAVLVAMNGWWTGPEMRNALELAKPELVVMDEKRMARLAGDPGVPTIVIERDFQALLESPDVPLPAAPINEDDPFMLIFTSGTTGRPKAAVLSHRSVIGYLMLQSFLGFRGLVMSGRTPGPPPVRLAPFPLFHVSGLSATVSTMMGAGTTVWPLGRFDPEAIIELTKREGVGVWNGATTHVMRLLESPAIATLNPTQIVQIGVGGSATTPGLVRHTKNASRIWLTPCRPATAPPKRVAWSAGHRTGCCRKRPTV